MKASRIFFVSVLVIIAAGFFLPEGFQMPVAGATSADYNHASFWYYPWGASGVHKGVDIFAAKGTAINPSAPGIVIYKGQLKNGGNVVAVLGPKWRVHYYAHMDEIDVSQFDIVGRHDILGTVGTTGNAAGKPPHLHYAIVTLFPYFWKADGSPQGSKKMFYLDPVAKLAAI